jgi:uncharacterized membrane protein YjjP (DUF1212 family)
MTVKTTNTEDLDTLFSLCLQSSTFLLLHTSSQDTFNDQRAEISQEENEKNLNVFQNPYKILVKTISHVQGQPVQKFISRKEMKNRARNQV